MNYIIIAQSFRGRGKHCEITGEIAAGGHDSGMGLHHVLRGAFCGIDTRRCPAATCFTKTVSGLRDVPSLSTTLESAL